MASEPAEPTTRPQDDRVGTVRRLGNSWFVKLVEPRSEPWHVACSKGQQNVSGWQSDEDMEDCPVVGYVPIAECVPGLLADPAQTTELERLRAEAEKYHRYYNDAMKVRLDVEEVLDEALGTEEEDGAGYGLAGDVALLAQHEKAARAEADTLRGKVEELEALRDALSLLLRGMARKLVDSRRQARLQAALSLEINQGWVAYRERTKAQRREFLDDIATLTRERDERQARINRIQAVLDQRDRDNQLTGDLFVQHPTPDTYLDRIAAVLVDDRPKAEEPKPPPPPFRAAVGHWVFQGYDQLGQPVWYWSTEDARAALSGEALRDVEERDDAAGDLP